MPILKPYVIYIFFPSNIYFSLQPVSYSLSESEEVIAWAFDVVHFWPFAGSLADGVGTTAMVRYFALLSSFLRYHDILRYRAACSTKGTYAFWHDVRYRDIVATRSVWLTSSHSRVCAIASTVFTYDRTTIPNTIYPCQTTISCHRRRNASLSELALSFLQSLVHFAFSFFVSRWRRLSSACFFWYLDLLIVGESI
jgi:hypothetical protein